jgi:hypothetical protein
MTDAFTSYAIDRLDEYKGEEEDPRTRSKMGNLEQGVCQRPRSVGMTSTPRMKNRNTASRALTSVVTSHLLWPGANSFEGIWHCPSEGPELEIGSPKTTGMP